MTYVVQIWEPAQQQAVPGKIQDVVQMVEAIQNTCPGQNPKFLELAKRLTRRFPCICSEKGAALPEDEWAWTDGPLDGETDEAVYGLGLNLSMLEKVRPFVLQQAQALGLCVLDQQAGEAYWSDGKFLSIPQPPQVARSEKNYDDIPKMQEVRQLVADRIEPLLNAYGFKRKKGGLKYKRTFPLGWQTIDITKEADKWPSYATFDVQASSRIHVISDLKMAINKPELLPEGFSGIPIFSKKERDQYAYETISTVLRRWMDDKHPFLNSHSKLYEVRSYSEIDTVIAHLIQKLETRLLPVMEKSKDIAGFNAMVNTEPLSDSVWNLMVGANPNIIAAYLAGDPRLEKLCEYFAKTQLCYEGTQPSTLRCIEYVRSHPVPPPLPTK